MPRLRIVILAALVTLASGGLAAGVAWRWLVREWLARRAGRTTGWEPIARTRETGLQDLRAGLAFLPVTWGGFLLALPLLPSAFPDLAPHGLWLGWAPVVALPVAGTALLLGLLARAYATASSRLEVDASTDPRPGAWRRPFVLHAAAATVLCLPAVVVGAIVIFSWPGLTALRVAVACAVLAPAVGALVAMPSLLTATNAVYVAPPLRARRAPRALPRWAVPAGLLTLAFSWGVVGARVQGVATDDSPFLSARALARLEPRLRRAERKLHTYGNVIGAGRLIAAGLECETDVVQWAPVGSRAIGWCEDWIEGRDGGSYGTVFFLATDTDFREDRLPTIQDRTFLGTIEAVAPVPGGVLVVERRPGSMESRPETRDAVVLSVRGLEIVQTARRPLPVGVSNANLTPLGAEVAVTFQDLWPRDERWILFDRRLEPQRVSARDRLADELGWLWLGLLAIAALATVFAVTRVLRAGRLGRVLRRRASRRGAAAMPGPGLFGGRLEPTGALALLHTDGGESLAIDPERATWVGWPDTPERTGACVVVGERRAARGGAYRGGLAEVRAGRPFAIVRGDLTTAISHADALREASLRRSLPLLWAVSLVPFAAVIAAS